MGNDQGNRPRPPPGIFTHSLTHSSVLCSAEGCGGVFSPGGTTSHGRRLVGPQGGGERLMGTG